LKEKLKTKQNNIMQNNVTFTPDSAVEALNINFSTKAQLGRPVNPNSKRQQRLATAPGKKTGRPINPNSKRQQRLAEIEAKRQNGELKRGRPVNPNSKRQQMLLAKAQEIIEQNAQ
jgi:hypothetical protein